MDSPNPSLPCQISLVQVTCDRTECLAVSFVLRCKRDGVSQKALNIKFCQRLGKTLMETLEILSMVILPKRDQMSVNSTEVLKRGDNPSNTMSTFGDRLHGMNKMLWWCLNVFEKIVVKHFQKSWKVHTARRRRLRESIRRKRPQFWQSDDLYILHDNVQAYRS
ncbi:hypothetical protein TNCV_401251 [Trichonephila clavipes]|nr:hypothetical protein TNCV_401251 [Trichonephila clavipes]